MKEPQAPTSSNSASGSRAPRRRSVASHPAAPWVAFSVVIACVAFLLWLMGPIDLYGGRGPAGRFFVAVVVPIIGVAWLYDPIVRRLDRSIYPEIEAWPPGGSVASVDAETRRLDKSSGATRRASKSRATHPVSSYGGTPYVYAIAVLGLMIATSELLGALGVWELRDAISAGYVFIVGAILGAMFAYDKVIDVLDRWIGSPPA
jgi:hypothetical protein